MRRYIWWIVLAGALLIIPGCFLCRACRAPSDTNPAQSSSNQPASSQPASGQPSSNQPPKAIIQSVTPAQPQKGQKVSFKGTGTDADGTVVGYGWRSSIDGDLSSEASFDTSKLSAGSHVIYFKVIDNSGARSQEATTKLVVEGPTGQATISKAAIRWQSPNKIFFTWNVSNLNPDLEYWVCPDVGFTENSGAFGPHPEDSAKDLEIDHDFVARRFLAAAEGKGSYTWGTQTKPQKPSGELALISYDPKTNKARVVDTSGPINISDW